MGRRHDGGGPGEAQMAGAALFPSWSRRYQDQLRVKGTGKAKPGTQTLCALAVPGVGYLVPSDPRYITAAVSLHREEYDLSVLKML